MSYGFILRKYEGLFANVMCTCQHWVGLWSPAWARRVLGPAWAARPAPLRSWPAPRSVGRLLPAGPACGLRLGALVVRHLGHRLPAAGPADGRLGLVRLWVVFLFLLSLLFYLIWLKFVNTY